MRLPNMLSLCFTVLALAAPLAAATDAPVGVPPAYMDSVAPGPAAAAHLRTAELTPVRVAAADAARVQIPRARDSKPAAPAAAAPEPSSWPILLSGLLLVGFIARRRANWPEA
jgi:hypothetical protein